MRTHVNNTLKRPGTNTHPCFTPLDILTDQKIISLREQVVMLLWKRWIALPNLLAQPSFSRIAERSSLTQSKAMVKSTKTIHRSILFYMNFS